MIELLKPLGIEQARRWVSLLALVPANERESMIRSVEQRIGEVYGRRDADE